MHPYVHRRQAPTERPAQRRDEVRRILFDEVPAREPLPWRLRNLQPEVLQAFREARWGDT